MAAVLARYPIVTNLQQRKYLFIAVGVAFLMFDVSYYVMRTFPGSRDFMCLEGANFTPSNIVFSVVLSIMMGFLMAGIFSLFIQKYKQKRGTLTSLSGLAFFVGMMSVVCTACTFPVLSLFGFSVWLTFFTEYELAFKIVSFGLMSFSLFLLNKQLNDACTFCAPMPEKS